MAPETTRISLVHDSDSGRILFGRDAGVCDLVEAPHGTFAGALSLGFCPALPLRRPLCRGNGLEWVAGPKGKGVSFLPADSTAAPWVVLQGESDSTCYASRAAAYVRRIRAPGSSSCRRWGTGSRWGIAMGAGGTRRLRSSHPCDAGGVGADALAVRDLPLVELRGRGNDSTLAIIVSGDGGWASLDRQIGETFVSRGISVVGLDALRYFWKAAGSGTNGRRSHEDRAPLSGELGQARIVTRGLLARGGNTALHGKPVAARTQEQVRLVALLGAHGPRPSSSTSGTGWGEEKRGARQATAPEIQKLRGLPILCIYGTDEKDSVCPLLPDSLATSMPVQGGHHFGGGYRDLASRILRAAHRD